MRPSLPIVRVSTLCVSLALLAPSRLSAQPAGAPAGRESAPAQLIVTNARITTQDLARPEAEALAIRDGELVAAGREAEILPLRGDATRVIDAGGRRVIPGLNDSHLHATRGGKFYNLELRWDGVRSLAHGLRMIREQAQRTPPGQWVRVVGGWSPYQFNERRMPTAAELNAAAPQTPVLVVFLYSQGLLNAAGVAALQLTAESQPPVGGRYEFVAGGGAILHADPNPTILYGAIARLPGLSPADQLNSTMHFYRELNRFGLTSVIDPGGGGHAYPADYAATRTLASQPAFPLRISNYLFAQKGGAELQDFQRWTEAEQLNVNLAAARLNGLVIEGAGENLVWSAGDFENFLSPRPELAERMERELTDVVRVLAKHQWPIRIHATYDESITRVLNVFEPVFKETAYGARWCIDHAETISAANISRINALGGGIAIQNRMAFAGEYFVERYGAATAASAPPLRRLLAAGVPLGAGTDATRVSSYNPWLALHWMVTGRTVGGTQVGSSQNRLTRAEALRLYTLGSAWFSGEEDVKGCIAPGQFADFAILSGDYFTAPDDEIPAIESLLTVIGGEIVYAAAPFESLDPAPLPAVSPAWSPVAAFGGYQQFSTSR